jgi:uncharacterized protein YjbJ (UPF0337 family)
MNKDQVKGAAHQIKGKVKKGIGKAIGNKSLEREGAIEDVAGEVQGAYGDAKKSVKDSTE